ncbi:MAG: hypothetical protein CMJ35_03710 [Phycisphaerae bacterium]|nr:hypothetical protein [Phycisphaerae bacterium]MBM90705.1 hypothetical protein [Phycisphaerae bacterium]
MKGIARKLATTLVATAGLVSHMWLPYQQAWIEDDSDTKIWEKSRRIGADYCESFCCVTERLDGSNTSDYWYSSADESAALEFGEYVKMWLQLYNMAAEVVMQQGLDDGKDWLKMTITLPQINGRRPRITVMTSSPKRFRSKGGDICLSELAFHEQAHEMWKAAVPVATWGGKIRIISSHNGVDSVFNQLIEQARKHEDPELYGEPKSTDFKASVHRVDIYDAVNQGLCERINEVSGSNKSRDEFIADLMAMCATGEVFDEEFGCIPSKQSGSYFPHALLTPCVSPRCAVPTDDLDTFIADIKARSTQCDRVSGGSDIGRKSDRFVIWVWGRSGSKRITLGVLVYQNRDFDVMEHAINTLMSARLMLAGSRVLRVSLLSIDETGLGMQLAERMEKKHRGRAEGITMSTAVKEDMFTRLRAGVEELSVELPDDTVVLADISSIRKEVTAAGNVRYSAASNEHGHADRATAAALGLVADESARAMARTVDIEEGCW